MLEAGLILAGKAFLGYMGSIFALGTTIAAVDYFSNNDRIKLLLELAQLSDDAIRKQEPIWGASYGEMVAKLAQDTFVQSWSSIRPDTRYKLLRLAIAHARYDFMAELLFSNSSFNGSGEIGLLEDLMLTPSSAQAAYPHLNHLCTAILTISASRAESFRIIAPTLTQLARTLHRNSPHRVSRALVQVLSERPTASHITALPPREQLPAPYVKAMLHASLVTPHQQFDAAQCRHLLAYCKKQGIPMDTIAGPESEPIHPVTLAIQEGRLPLVNACLAHFSDIPEPSRLPLSHLLPAAVGDTLEPDVYDTLTLLARRYVFELYAMIQHGWIGPTCWRALLKKLKECKQLTPRHYPYLAHLTVAFKDFDKVNVVDGFWESYDSRALWLPYHHPHEYYSMPPLMAAVACGNWSAATHLMKLPEHLEALTQTLNLSDATPYLPEPRRVLVRQLTPHESMGRPTQYKAYVLLMGLLFEQPSVVAASSGAAHVEEQVVTLLKAVLEQLKTSIRLDDDLLAFLASHHWIDGLQALLNPDKRNDFITRVNSASPDWPLEERFEVNRGSHLRQSALCVAIQWPHARQADAIHYLLAAQSQIGPALDVALERYQALKDTINPSVEAVETGYSFLLKHDRRCFALRAPTYDVSQPQHLSLLWEHDAGDATVRGDAGYHDYQSIRPLLRTYALISYLTFVERTITQAYVRDANKQRAAGLDKLSWRKRRDQWRYKGARMLNSHFLPRSPAIVHGPESSGLADRYQSAQYLARYIAPRAWVIGARVPVQEDDGQCRLYDVASIIELEGHGRIYFLSAEEYQAIKIVCFAELTSNLTAWSRHDAEGEATRATLIDQLLGVARLHSRVEVIEIAGYGAGGGLAMHLMVKLMSSLWRARGLGPDDCASIFAYEVQHHRYQDAACKEMLRALSGQYQSDLLEAERHLLAVLSQPTPPNTPELTLKIATIAATGVDEATDILSQACAIMLNHHVLPVRLLSYGAKLEGDWGQQLCASSLFSRSHREHVTQELLKFHTHKSFLAHLHGYATSKENIGFFGLRALFAFARGSWLLAGAYAGLQGVDYAKGSYDSAKEAHDDLIFTETNHEYTRYSNETEAKRDDLSAELGYSKWAFRGLEWSKQAAYDYGLVETAKQATCSWWPGLFAQARRLDPPAITWLETQRGANGQCHLPTLRFFTQHHRYDYLPGDAPMALSAESQESTMNNTTTTLGSGS